MTNSTITIIVTMVTRIIHFPKPFSPEFFLLVSPNSDSCPAHAFLPYFPQSLCLLSECVTPMNLSVSPDFFSFVASIHHDDIILHTYIRIMRSLRDQNSSLCYYLSPFYLVKTKILTFISPARMTLNRGICKTLILTLRSLMASYHFSLHLPQGSWHLGSLTLG